LDLLHSSKTKKLINLIKAYSKLSKPFLIVPKNNSAGKRLPESLIYRVLFFMFSSVIEYLFAIISPFKNLEGRI